MSPMSTMAMLKKLCSLGFLAAALVAFAVTEASAQGFFIPFIGYDYGGDSTCPGFTGCEDKKVNYGAAVGKLGQAAGFEQEFAYAKDFFSRIGGEDSGVLTIMSNLMLAPKIGPVRPYVLGGIGLMKAHVDLGPSAVLSFSNNTFAWDIGFGLVVHFGRSVGIRGDVRHFHSFEDLETLNFSNRNKLNFARASVGLVLMF
jgi:opacity protein-like surface antigen